MQNENTLASRSELHIMRRIWHTISGVLGLVAYLYTDISLINWGMLFLMISLCGFALDFKRLGNKDLNNRFKRIFRPIMRSSEDDGFSGLPFYALGVAGAVFLYEEHIAILAIMYLIFADPIASVFGVYFGKDKILPNKTFQGTLAAFVTCFFITYGYVYALVGFTPGIFLYSFSGALFGAVSEILGAFNIDDNFTIPIFSGLGLTALSSALGIF